MILSGRDLQLYIEMGKLKIDPVTRDQFQQNGIDLILDSLAEGDEYAEKIRLEDVARDISSKMLPCFISGRFYLGCLREWIELPDDLMAFVEIRSSWARKGLFLPPTIVDAGFRGNLTLEIASFSSIDVPYGQRFAHLIFAKTTGPCVPYRGKYQNQKGITRPIDDNDCKQHDDCDRERARDIVQSFECALTAEQQDALEVQISAEFAAARASSATLVNDFMKLDHLLQRMRAILASKSDKR